MIDLQITCTVLVTDGDSQRIGFLGVASEAGLKMMQLERMVAQIIAGTHSFYTMVGGNRANVQVIDSDPPYLRTDADTVEFNNLLELPNCLGI